MLAALLLIITNCLYIDRSWRGSSQWLRGLAALAKDLNSVSSINIRWVTTAYNFISKRAQHPLLVSTCTHTHVPNKHINQKNHHNGKYNKRQDLTSSPKNTRTLRHTSLFSSYFWPRKYPVLQQLRTLSFLCMWGRTNSEQRHKQ